MDEEGVTPCDHLTFVFIGEVGEFVYQSNDFGRRFQTIKNRNVSLDTVERILKRLGYDNKMLAIEITFGGMACGPVWYTNIFGFDYGTLDKKES